MPLYRVKRYAHHKYKFVVRTKVGTGWKRRYFRTKTEANAYAEKKNTLSSTFPVESKQSDNIQDAATLDTFYSTDDPWGYHTNAEDAKRRAVLLAELPKRDYTATLDIGCGNGFVTSQLPGKRILGVDISAKAIGHARRHEDARLSFTRADLFELDVTKMGTFDLIVVTGLFYTQYIGKACILAQTLIDRLLAPGGVLASVHIAEWYTARFPYLLAKQITYPYREFTHVMEIYFK
jgi:SAM-dependent methyltransferase